MYALHDQFEDPLKIKWAFAKLQRIHQGNQLVKKYSVVFHEYMVKVRC